MIIFSYEFRRQRELSVQNRNLNITSAFNKKIENLISGKIVQSSFQWFVLFTPGVNNLVSIKKSHTKASRAFLLTIYNVLVDFLFCKWDFSVSPFTLNHHAQAKTTFPPLFVTPFAPRDNPHPYLWPLRTLVLAL